MINEITYNSLNKADRVIPENRATYTTAAFLLIGLLLRSRIMKICKIQDCPKEAKRRNICHRHYMQIRRHGKTKGDPTHVPFDKNDIIIDKTVAKIILRNAFSEIVGEALIDIADVKKVKNHKWRLSTHGYVVSNKEQGRLKLQHVILNTTGAELNKKKLLPDHKDRNKLNNTRTNLRIVSHSTNCLNRCKIKNKKGRSLTSDFKGVCFVDNRWVAKISIDGEPTRLGRFTNEIEAAKVYDKKATELYGEFACTNKDLNLY